jgi:sporulation protein YlmC with PRC-barrel domain
VAAAALPALSQEATDAGASGDIFRTEATQGEIFASDLMGMRIYRADSAPEGDAIEGAQQDWDDIGEVGDLILTQDGTVEAVLVDVGGFLGIGENRIAVDMDQIRVVQDQSTAEDEGDFFLVLNAPRQSIEEAPVYGGSARSGDQNMDDQAMNDQSQGDAAGDGSDATAGSEVLTEGESGDVAVDPGTQAGTTDEAMANTDAAASDAAAGDDVADDDLAAADVDSADADEAPLDDQTSVRGTSAREGYVTAEEVDLTAERLTGAEVYDANEERIGDVSEIVLTDDGQVRSVVVDVGGFLGIGAKPVELELDSLDILRGEGMNDLRVYVSMTEAELEAMPDYEG